MARLHRGVVYLFVFSLAAAALLAQGNRPGTPTTPVSGGAAPQVVDRKGTVVGTLSQHTGLAFTLPDGRKTLLGWSRNSLGNVAPINFTTNARPMIHFTDPTCSGDAYVEFRGGGHPAGDPMALILSFEGPPPSGPLPYAEGEEPPIASETRTLYATDNGARMLLRGKQNFQAHYSRFSDPMIPPSNNPCRPGLDPNAQIDPWNPYVAAYQFKRTTVDLNAYEWPFHVVE